MTVTAFPLQTIRTRSLSERPALPEINFFTVPGGRGSDPKRDRGRERSNRFAHGSERRLPNQAVACCAFGGDELQDDEVGVQFSRSDDCRIAFEGA